MEGVEAWLSSQGRLRLPGQLPDNHINLDWGRGLFPPRQSLRSEPADLQRGEVEEDGLIWVNFGRWFGLWEGGGVSYFCV